MFDTLKKLFDDEHAAAARPSGEHERRHLQLAIASLLHEATRVDLGERPEEHAAAVQALSNLFGVSAPEAGELLREGRDKARHLVSYFAPVSIIKRDFPLAQRVLLIEHLWRIAYADGTLDQYEDHYVRKIAHLLYVPNTQSMLARNRARTA